ncbi:MAG: hypothetical protein EON58_05535 [Alphaproteobacteria bacterium]|nr:MAG: hypothetical protein EON58_05535 [Alphaproteobacteria bacterium]
MATAGELSKIYADALSVSEVHVAVRYRALREAGLVIRAARGRHTPDRTPLEVARLLIAVMGAQAIADVEAVVRWVGQLGCVHYAGPEKLRRQYETHSFEQILLLILVDLQLIGEGKQAEMGTTGAKLAITLSQTRLLVRVENRDVYALYEREGDGSGLPIQTPQCAAATTRLLSNRMHRGLEIEARVEGQALAVLTKAITPWEGYTRLY